MNLFERFSLNDFLVILFPGLASGVGLVVAAVSTPAGGLIRRLDLGLGGSASLIVLSYVIGVVLADHSKLIARGIGNWLGLSDARGSISKHVDAKAVMHILAARFGADIAGSQWSTSAFYLCRTLVRERLPRSFAEAERQNVLRQMRENLVVTLAIWTLAGVAWAARLWSYDRLISASVAAVSLLVGWRLAVSLVRRMHGNGQREVRELCSALLVGESIGVFDSTATRGPVTSG